MLCQPSRATIATGTYPSTHGVTCNGIDLPEHWAEKTISAQLGRAGYETAIFGKAHFASSTRSCRRGDWSPSRARPSCPRTGPARTSGSSTPSSSCSVTTCAWPHCRGTGTGASGPRRWVCTTAATCSVTGRRSGRERLAQMQPEYAGAAWDHTQTWASSLPEEDHPTTWVADRAIEWLRGVDGDFFAWVSFTDPHHPMDPPEPWAHQYDPADVVEMLPTAHPEEFDAKPPIHRLWTQGNRGGLFEFANPGGARYTRRRAGPDDRGLLRHGEPARLPDRACAPGPRGARPPRRHARARDRPDHGEMLGHHQMIFKGPLHYDDLLRVPLIANGPGFGPVRCATTRWGRSTSPRPRCGGRSRPAGPARRCAAPGDGRPRAHAHRERLRHRAEAPAPHALDPRLEGHPVRGHARGR